VKHLRHKLEISSGRPVLRCGGILKNHRRNLIHFFDVYELFLAVFQGREQNFASFFRSPLHQVAQGV
jgi:hypothetical protein